MREGAPFLVVAIFWFLAAGDRAKERHYRAWDLINSARGSAGDGGRIDALQDLNKDHVSLMAGRLIWSGLTSSAPKPCGCLPAGRLARVHVSANNASGADNIKFSLLESFSEPSTTPTGRTWHFARADDTQGTNTVLQAVTCGGLTKVISRARSYLWRVCSVTTVSDAVNITVLTMNEMRRGG